MQFDSMLRTMHRLPDAQRYALGTYIEDWAREQVNKKMTRYTWEKCSDAEDRQKKQDWKTYTPSGRRINAQFKSRNTGNDILVSIYQPYRGFDEENTWARDMVGQDLDFYITYPPGGRVVYVSRATEIKNLCKKLLNEWERRGEGKLPFYSQTFAECEATRLNPNPACCQLRVKVEEGQGYRKGETKLLAFLPPQLVPCWQCPVNPAELHKYLEIRLSR